MYFQEEILQKYGVLIRLLLSVCFACNLANGPVVSSAVVALVVVLWSLWAVALEEGG